MNPTCFFEGDVAQIQCLESLISRLLEVSSYFAGIIFLIMFLIGSFRYLLSGGDPKKVEGARGTLTAAFFGLMFIVSSYIILGVLYAFTGINLTRFQIVNFF